jgi:predicted transcriptional regulator
MKVEGISQLPVLEQDVLVGLVTEHDILQALVAGSGSVELSMAEVMNRRISTVAPEDPIQVLVDAFSREEVGLVADADRHLVGILAKIDLVEYMTQR